MRGGDIGGACAAHKKGGKYTRNLVGKSEGKKPHGSF
jgi:hypothetical protein